MKNNVYLITGPIGSGKSSALELISNLDLFTVDLDKVSNNILNQTESFNFIKNNFPDAIENNKISKQVLANIVFNDDEELKKLENYLHPRVLNELDNIVSSASGPIFVEVSAPKTIHNKYEVLVIFADKEVRVERLLSRGMQLDDINNRIATQQDDDWWLGLGKVIYNNNFEDFKTELLEFIKEVT